MTDTEEKRSDGNIEIPVKIGNTEEKRTPVLPSDQKPSEVTLDSYLRLQAEFANYRKRVKKEQEQSHSYARGELIRMMLPVVDDFERLLHHHTGGEGISREGIMMIYQKLQKILRDEGLEEIPALNERFDPEVHEAVSAEETENNLVDRVLEVWLKGYRFKDRILRPAKVKVGRQKRTDSESP